MECWIGVVDEACARVVHVAGRLAGVHVPDLLAACAEASRPVHVDLSEVVSVDAVGVKALCRIRDAGHALVGTPKYIELKLESAQAGPRRLP